MCTSTSRKTIGSRKLGRLVDAQLAQWMQACKTFTAYDVTQALRTQHPDLEIVHPDVRRRVWMVMAGHPDYDAEARDYGGTMACTWYPAPTQQSAPFTQIGGLIVWRN